MRAAIPVAAVPGVPTFPARVQTEVAILPHVNATALAAPQPTELHIEQYEYSRCHD
jgi:hypothetical protein